MKHINTDLLFKALIRGGIPFTIMTVISAILRSRNDNESSKSVFFNALIFFIIGSASVIYDIDSWSFMKQSLVHFVLMLVTIYPILLISGWFKVNSLKDALFVLVIFLMCGVVLWSVMYFLAKKFNW